MSERGFSHGSVRKELCEVPAALCPGPEALLQRRRRDALARRMAQSGALPRRIVLTSSVRRGKYGMRE